MKNILKKTLEKRLSSLCYGELVSILIFIPVSYLINHTYPNLQLYSLPSFWVSFILLEFLLLQGTTYWYIKLKRLKNENNSTTPNNIVQKFYHLKKVNMILIALTLVVFALDFIKWYPTLPLGGLILSLLIYVFAILEFVNYFYIQLSYDNKSDIRNLLDRKKLKPSSMSKDFKRIGKSQ